MGNWIPSNLVQAANRWVDRDPSSADFSSFTMDGAYHDLDLSSIVPAGATKVKIKYYGITGTSSCIYFYLKNKDAVVNFGPVMQQDCTTNGVIDVPIGSDLTLEYKFSAAWSSMNLYVIGWYIDEQVDSILKGIDGLTILRKTSSQAVSSNIWEHVDWDVADYDNLNAWSSGVPITVPSGINWIRINSFYLSWNNTGSDKSIIFRRSSGTGTTMITSAFFTGLYEGTLSISSSWVSVVPGDTYFAAGRSSNSATMGYDSYTGAANITIEWAATLSQLHI